MKFNIFSSTETKAHYSTAMTRSLFDADYVHAEQTALTTALYALLESLPQSYRGEDNIQRMCATILNATQHLRLMWVGFCESDTKNTAPNVTPFAVVGECVPESADWRLPNACFDFSAPYSQASQESLGAFSANSLFEPWRSNMDACSVNCGLAIPLRSDRAELRGLVVFYADDLNYFSHMGVVPFQALCHVAEIIWQQSNLMQMLTQKAQLDTLTGLMNRRKTMHALRQALEHADRENEILSIMILRIGGFGKINETYGWTTADAILALFAKEIGLQMRAQDKIGRWTGVEFLYVLPRTDMQHATLLAQGLQRYFISHPIAVKHQSVRLTLHVGVAAYAERSHQLDELIQQANHNLLASIPSAH